jgi:hypothetical protein
MIVEQPIYIVNLMRSIVSKVSANLTAQLQTVNPKFTGVHYLHGHPLEIVETLAQMDSSKTLVFDKYPMVALFQDFKEPTGAGPGLYGTVKLNLVIACDTERNYTADERYCKTFEPILYPIYGELVRQIWKSGYFMLYSTVLIKSDKIDRVYWGKQGLYGSDANIFNDNLDAIELNNLTLTVYNQYC